MFSDSSGEQPREEDPAWQPLREAGQGEAEGFEEAERELEDNATHGDGRGFPREDQPGPEEDPGSEFGEADDVIPPDGPEEDEEAVKKGPAGAGP